MSVSSLNSVTIESTLWVNTFVELKSDFQALLEVRIPVLVPVFPIFGLKFVAFLEIHNMINIDLN